MTNWLRFLLWPIWPHIERCNSLPPVTEPAPDPEYQRRLDQAAAARRRAEEITATLGERKPPTTRPA